MIGQFFRTCPTASRQYTRDVLPLKDTLFHLEESSVESNIWKRESLVHRKIIMLLESIYKNRLLDAFI